MNIATSGTYKIHKTTAPHGTDCRKVRPVCGQSVRSSALSVVSAENEAYWYAKPVSQRCKKCFNV